MIPCSFTRRLATAWLASVVSVSALAVDSEHTPSAKVPAVTVIGAEYPPYVIKGTEQPTGFAIDLLEAIQQDLKWDTQLDVLPWGRAYQLALQQPNVLVLCIGNTEVRTDSFLWADPYVEDEIHLFSLASRADIQLTDARDITRYSVVTYRQGGPKSILDALGVRPERLVFVDSPSQLVQLLALGRVDFVADFSKAFQYTSATYSDERLASRPLSEHPKGKIQVGFALSKSTSPALLSALNAAQQRVRDEGHFAALEQKWFAYLRQE